VSCSRRPATGPEARRPRLMWALALGPCASSLPSRSASARPRFSLSGVLHGAVRARGRHQLAGPDRGGRAVWG